MLQNLNRLACSAIRLSWEYTRELIALCVVGLLVALVMAILHRIEFVKNIDRYATDILMRYAAQERLRQGPPDAALPVVPINEQEQGLTDAAPPVLFINVGETSCREWTRVYNGSCTLGVITSREHLRCILEKIDKLTNDKKPKPKLVVIDIELAPLLPHEARDKIDCPGGEPSPESADSSNKDLREAVLHFSHDVPLIALRPMVIDPEGKPPISSFRSILDPDVPGRSNSGGGYPENLWFASAIIQADSDGVVRSVHGWDAQYYEPTDEREMIAGVGLLGAALLSGVKPDDLACIFAGSKPGLSCRGEVTRIVIHGREYQPDMYGGWKEKIHRIRFSLPFEQPGHATESVFPYSPYMIDTVEATEFEHHTVNYSRQLENTVVMIGGSYLASGDLRATPLGGEMPGAMIHANAIRAFYTAKLIEESEFSRVEFLLIVTAASIGAGFHVLRRSLTTHMRNRVVISLTGAAAGVVVLLGWQAGLAIWSLVAATSLLIALAACIGFLSTRILLSLYGIAIAAVSVLLVGTSRGFSDLIAGTAISTFTPALAVAFEGLCDVLRQIKEFVARCLARVAPSRTRPNDLTFDAVVAITVVDEAAPPRLLPNEMASRDDL
jgi:CHASE2 domain-containing sensor protein